MRKKKIKIPKNIKPIYLPFILIAYLFYALVNERPETFTSSKKIAQQVYSDNKITFYCNAKFDEEGAISLPKGFVTPEHNERSSKREWEHIVPAEKFGRTFTEWKKGSHKCVDSKGESYKGRKCATTNKEFAKMEADMYNLVPAIGAVNAMRSNYNFTEFSSKKPSTFGACKMVIENNKVEPPQYTKGFIARTYFYFEKTYPRFKISKSMKKMFDKWDQENPVDQWECKRAQRIEFYQGNRNDIVTQKCKNAGLWSFFNYPIISFILSKFSLNL